MLELVAQGNMTGATELLMQRHGQAVYRFCREIVRDPTLADDVQQQVFIQAHQDLPRFRREAAVKTWLLGIARHRSIDAIRWWKRWWDRHSHEEPVVSDPRRPIGESLDDARLRAALTRCIEKLGKKTRVALLLRFQQGLTYEDMADICSDKPGTLQARVSRALPALRECIERCTGRAS